MTGKIRVLDEHTANQIAAGEVVERPASVVKELLENSIDAGSTSVEVEIREGGLEYIRVTDNGEGMEEADALLAFQRHATSKITGTADLHNILTLGFRGEALPSIAAVAKVELTTRPRERMAGTEVVITGGQLVHIGEVGCPPGTRLVVKDLFYNTPARRKFLKSVVTEGGHIGDVVSRLALANPGISFKFINNGRVIINTPGTGHLMDAIISIYGRETSKHMVPLNLRGNGLSIVGYLAKPEFSRSNRAYQTVFINGRYIRSQAISQAVAEGYHTLLETGRQPVFILGLELAAARVDVNVHPTKMEVRLGQENEIREMLTKGVADTLRGHVLIPGVNLEEYPVQEQPVIRKNEAIYRQDVLELANHRLEKTYADKELSYQTRGIMVAETAAAEVNSTPVESNSVDTPSINPDTGKRQTEIVLPAHCESERTYNAGSSAVDSPLKQLLPLGQVNSSYIIARGEDGLYIIDQHAAHERILYEKFMAVASRTEPSVQQLLIPITLELTHLEAQVLIDNIMVFNRIGFILEHFGGDTFLVRAVPQGLTKGDEKQLFLDLLDELAESGGKKDAVHIKEHLITIMACKAAIKANHPIPQELQDELLQQLAGTSNPYTCPHGRPTIIHLSSAELEKKFKRI